MENNVVDQYFDNLPKEDKEEKNIFDTSVPEKEPEGKTEPSEDDSPKNRRERRLLKRLDASEKARIAADTRAQVLSEINLHPEKIGDIDHRLVQLYGDNENGKLASKLTQDLLNDTAVRVREQVLQEIEEREKRVESQRQEFESFIDSQLESLEDQNNVDLTSNAPAARKTRREFLEIVQNLSPKDPTGNITAYADFTAAWDMYQMKQQKPDASRQKELASRSMAKGSGAAQPQRKITPGFDGWKTDFGLH